MPWRFGPSEQPLEYLLEEDKALYRGAEDLGLKANGLKVLAFLVRNAHRKLDNNAALMGGAADHLRRGGRNQ